METVGLHHFNIKAPLELIERVRDFYVEVLGLTVGDRPNFSRRGFWLYSRNAAIVHLTAYDDADARMSVENGKSFLDHVAFSCEGLAGLLSRLKRLKVAYDVVELPSVGQIQVFVRDPAGVGVELNFTNESLAKREAAAAS
jgi:catechol 2,3-dioxygenase-like lactoylglutathione lyase family enzyme